MNNVGAGPATRPAVFLDRDGVLIEDSPHYIRSVEQVRLLSGAAAAVRRLNENCIPVVVVTNQSAIARGLISEPDLDAINERMFSLLASESGARVDRLYYCPYHPEGTVPEYTRASWMRKPAPGMLLQAARDLDIDLSNSFLVGDQESDMVAAKRVGCHAIAVLTGPSTRRYPFWKEGRPDAVAADLDEAVSRILEMMKDVKV